PARAKRRAHPWARPLRGLLVPTSPPPKGPGRAARILRALLEKPNQRQGSLRGCSCSRSRFAAASECAPGARCFTRGPYGAAGGWRKVRRMARRDAGQFFAGTGVPSKNPVTRPRTRSPWMGGGRAIGVPFLFGYFLFGHAKRKELGRRQAHETALRLARNKSARSPQPSPPTMFGES